MRHSLLATTLLAAAGCSAMVPGGDPGDKAAGAWSPSKDTGAFTLVEAGPAPVGASVDVTLAGAVPGYRVESFGNMKLTIDLAGHGGADAYLVVEGPLDGYGDTVAVGAGTVVAEDDDSGPGTDSHIELTLTGPGVYRILAGTFDSLGEGQAAMGALTLSVACTDGCYRAQVDQAAFVRGLASDAGSAFIDYANNEISALIPDADSAAQYQQQLQDILADANLSGLDRFPTIPLSVVAALRPALGAIPSTAPAPADVVTGELTALLGACMVDRSDPAPLDARLPGVAYGSFPNRMLAPCQAAHSPKLAAILTSLAANNGSVVTYHGTAYSTPSALIGALVAAGHTIEVRNERMYADFISFTVGQADLTWPVWIDTGLALSSGDDFTIPVGHSQHEWRITGPDVDTRITFYLGISGAGFFGQTDSRPAWSGTIASSDITISGGTSDTNYGYLLETFDAASAYLRRNTIEAATVAAGLPADGYGYVGVCNDSNTLVEYMTLGSITAFPLLRAKSLDAQPDLGDGLDAPMRALPKDGDGIVDPDDALRRAVSMQPFPDGSTLYVDSTLADQVAQARADLAD